MLDTALSRLSGSPARDVRAALVEDLRAWFRHRGMRAFVGRDVVVVPRSGAPLVADVAVALDVDPRPRRAWIAALEGRTVDVVFRFAEGQRLPFLAQAAQHVELGASEAFVFDRGVSGLWGFRRKGDRVDAISPLQGGAMRSRALGVELVPRAARLTLAQAGGPLGDLVDVLDRLERALDVAQRRRAPC